MRLKSTLAPLLNPLTRPTKIHVPPANGRALHAPPGRKALILDPRLFYTSGIQLSASGEIIDMDRDEVQGRIAYVAAALAYICMDYRATKLAEAPLMVVEEGDEGDEWIDDHELNTLLERPAPDMPMQRMIQYTSLLLDATGACLWVKVRGRDGASTMQLRAFGKDDVKVEQDNDRWWGTFRVKNVRGPERVYSWRDVIYFFNISLNDPIDLAVAPLDVALKHLNLGESLRVQTRNLIRNALRPPGMLTTDEMLTDEQYERAREQITQSHGGLNVGQPLIVEGGMEWTQISQTLDAVLPDEVIAWVEATVCAVFRLHPSMLGIKTGIENAPWSQLQQATRNLYDNAIIPQWKMLEADLTHSLLREVDDDPTHYVRFDRSAIPILQDDFEQKATAYKGWEWAMTRDEARVMVLGLEPLGGEEGKQIYVPSNWTPADLMLEQMQEPELAPFGEEEPSPNGGPPDAEITDDGEAEVPAEAET